MYINYPIYQRELKIMSLVKTNSAMDVIVILLEAKHQSLKCKIILMQKYSKFFIPFPFKAQ